MLLAEPHYGLADGVRSLLARLFDAVVMVAEEASMYAAAERLRPELVVVDLSLAKGDLAGLMVRLRQKCPGLKVIVLGDADSPSVVNSVLTKGADGFLAKHRVVTALLPAVEAVRRGERYAGSHSIPADDG